MIERHLDLPTPDEAMNTFVVIRRKAGRTR
jgi:hypothetical protein